jgi:type IV pilus assembly protein PilE
MRASDIIKASGFTLLELLLTLAIAGILAAIAWPGYAAILRRAQRDEARLALLGVQYAEELRYQRFLSYSDALDTPTAEGGLGLAPRSASGSYTLAVELSGSGQGYRAIARPASSGPQAQDQLCARLMIDETGHRSAVDADGRDTSLQCWR